MLNITYLKREKDGSSNCDSQAIVKVGFDYQTSPI